MQHRGLWPAGRRVLVIAIGLFGLLTVPATAAPSSPATVVTAGGPTGGPPLDPPRSPVPRGHFHQWTGVPGDVAGGIIHAPGEVIVTDTPFDDHGADTTYNTDPTDLFPNPAAGANADTGYGGTLTGGANGDYKYPASASYASNATDIVETRLAADAGAWYLLVRLNILLDPELVAIEARVDSHVLVVHGQTGAIDGHAVDVVADPAQALFEVRVPRAAYDPGVGTHHVLVASGLWDTAAHTWLYPASGKAPYFDLAYTAAEGMDTYWRDRVQSADIAAASYASHQVAVDFGALAAGGCPGGGPCPDYSGPSSGLFSRVFRSGQSIGAGVDIQTRYGQSAVYIYRSPTQPYAIYVPQHQTGGLVLLLHFLGGNHMSYPLTSMPGLAAWAEQLGVVVAMPLGRGGGGWYEGEAEKDVFEVWRDVAQHYVVDPDRVYLAGMSMGGYGTWRLGQLYPDLFSRGIIWSGPVMPNAVWAYPTPPPAGPNLTDLFGNTRDLPLFVLHGGLDELVPSISAEYWMGRYANEGNATYRYAFYPTRRHETTYPGATGNWVTAWLGGLPRRDTNPVHVTYKLIAAYAQPNFGITYDGAYWARGLALAPGAAEGSIDANRASAGGTATVLPDQYGVDALGPYRLRGQDVAAPAQAPNFVDLKLTHLAHAVLDSRRMGWSPVAPQHLTGHSDSAIDLVVQADYPGAVRVRGAAFTDGGDSVTLHLPPGAFDAWIELAPAAGAATQLPNTGGPPGSAVAIPAVLLLVLMLAGLRLSCPQD